MPGAAGTGRETEPRLDVVVFGALLALAQFLLALAQVGLPEPEHLLVLLTLAGGDAAEELGVVVGRRRAAGRGVQHRIVRGTGGGPLPASRGGTSAPGE